MTIKDIISSNEIILLIKEEMLISYIDFFYRIYFEVPESDEYEFIQSFSQKDYVQSDDFFDINMIKNGAVKLSQKINKGEIEL